MEWSRPGNRKLVPDKKHMFVVCDDSPTEDLLVHLADICAFIDKQTAPPDILQILQQAEEDAGRMVSMGGKGKGFGSASSAYELSQQGKVLVHCSQGVSRSPTVVIAYLMKKQKRPLHAVLADVKAKRVEIEPSENFMEQLEIWEKVGYEIWEDKARTVPKELYRRFLQSREEMKDRERQMEREKERKRSTVSIVSDYDSDWR